LNATWEKQRALLPPIDKVVALYEGGNKASTIAAMLGCKRHQIQRLLVKAGVYVPWRNSQKALEQRAHETPD
jgi:hypothetical protein